MSFDPLTILLGLVFLVVLLAVEGLFYFLRDLRGTDQAVNRRMRLLASGESSENVLLRLRRGDKRKSILAQLPGLVRIDRLLAQSGILMTTTRFVVICGVFAAVIFVLLQIFPILPFIGTIPIALTIGFGLPMFFLLYRRQARVKKF